jgi:hypothetical protein
VLARLPPDAPPRRERRPLALPRLTGNRSLSASARAKCKASKAWGPASSRTSQKHPDPIVMRRKPIFGDREVDWHEARWRPLQSVEQPALVGKCLPERMRQSGMRLVFCASRIGIGSWMPCADAIKARSAPLQPANRGVGGEPLEERSAPYAGPDPPPASRLAEGGTAPHTRLCPSRDRNRPLQVRAYQEIGAAVSRRARRFACKVQTLLQPLRMDRLSEPRRRSLSRPRLY